jgi:hypothetical protein
MSGISLYFLIHGDSGGNVIILWGDSVGHYEKKKVNIKKCRNVVNGNKETLPLIYF